MVGGLSRTGGRREMTVQSGLLRMDTPGGGHIVDITAGVENVLRTAAVERGLVSTFATGSTVAITTMEYEPGGVHDLQTLLDRLIPPAGNYKHNVRNHDTNAHAHLRASVSGRPRRFRSWKASSRSEPGSRSSSSTSTTELAGARLRSRSCRSDAPCSVRAPPRLTRSERRLVTERGSCANDF